MLFPQVLAGIYPIAQIQEPYTAVGYLASRIPVQALLHLRHPEAEEPSAEHPWCAWDVCEGGLPSCSLSTLPELVGFCPCGRNLVPELCGRGADRTRTWFTGIPY